MDDLTVKLTPAEWDIVGNALAMRPYAEVAALIEKLRQQLASKPSEEA